MHRRARVVHVITRLDLGGAQEIALYCVRHHDRAKYDVTLVAGEGGALDDEARGIEAADVHIVPWLVHPVTPLADLDALARLTRLFVRLRPDLVHAHSSKAGVLARLAARSAGVPVVVFTAHGWSFNDTQRPMARAVFATVERILARDTDLLFTVSERDRARGDALGIACRRSIEVLHCGIDVARFARVRDSREDVRRSLGCAPDDVLVGTIGNLKPQKDPIAHIECAAHALAREPRLRFVFVGDGPLRPQVEARIRALGVNERVHLLGWRRDVDKLLGAMDISLLLSRYEGLPRSVLEAFAAGLPVVATSVDGIPEVVVDDVTGRLVAPGDVIGAATALVELARDPTQRARFAAAGRARLVDDFDIHRMLAKLEERYDVLLDAARGRA